MTMQRFNAIFLCMILVAVGFLGGCGGSMEEKVYGGWKSEVNGDDGKPIIALISKDSLTVNGKTEAIAFQTLALNVEMVRAADRESLLMATGISAAHLDLQGSMLPVKNHTTVTLGGGKAPLKLRFIRITEDEAKQLMSGPQSLGREGCWATFVAELW